MSSRIPPILSDTYNKQQLNAVILSINQRLDELNTPTSPSGESATTTTRAVVDRVTHNLPLGRGVYFELASLAADAGLTGLSSGTDGRVIIIKNTGSFSLPLFHNSTSSSEGNRIKTRTEATLTIPVAGARALIYSTAEQAWIPFAEVP